MLGSIGTVLLCVVGSTAPRPAGYFYLQEGGYVAGEVVGADEQTVQIRLRDSRDIRSLEVDRLTPRSQYKLRALAVEGGADHLEVADFALEQGLFREAQRHYRAALREGPAFEEAALAGLEAVRASLEAERFETARELLADDRYAEAREILVDLASGSAGAVAERARGLLAELDERTRSEPYTLEASYPELAKVRRLIERAAERDRDGLLHTKSSSRSTRDFRAATQNTRRALALLERYESRHAGDPLFARAAGELRQRALEQHTTTALNQTSLYVVQQSFRRALVVLNEALAHDPGNARLLAARTRVEEAVSNASGVVLQTL